jgi:ABC-type uncharacterized transport system ATPase subunit
MVIINRGQAIIEGAVQDLLNAGRMKVTIETPDAARALACINASPLAKHVHSSTDGAVILMLEKSEIPDVAAMLSAAGVALYGIVPVRSLEEYFISLTRQVA